MERDNSLFLPFSLATCMSVICISERKSMPGQIVVGERYTLDRQTIYIDSDGDAFGVFYDARRNRVGNLRLSHFMTA